MERLGFVGIIIEDIGAAAAVNAVLHDYAERIVGRSFCTKII